MEDLIDKIRLGDSTWRIFAMPLQRKYGAPRGEGCLFVELGMMFGPLLHRSC